MAVNYSEEMKLPMPDAGGQNWGAIINGIVDLLDRGGELTFTFGETVAAGCAVALKIDGKIYKAQGTDPELTPAIGFAPNAVTSGNEGKVRWFGWIDIDTSWSVGATKKSWSPGDCAYLSSIPGRLTNVSYSWANILGWAKGHTNASYATRFVIHPHGICP